MANAPTFSSLPVEIHLEIVNHLDISTRFALAYTSRYFNQVTPRQVPPVTNMDKLDYLCTAETWPMFVPLSLESSHLTFLLIVLLTIPPRYDGYFSCSQCLKMRPGSAFAIRQLQGKRGCGNWDNARRFCISCGIRKQIYQPGHVIPIDEISRFTICWCSKFPGVGTHSLLFGNCTHCGKTLPVIHYIWGYAYQPCLDYFSCLFCGYRGTLNSICPPLRGQLDEIIQQYRNSLLKNSEPSSSQKEEFSSSS